MIATKDQRNPPLLPDFQHKIRKMRTRVGNFFQIFGSRISEVMRFRDDHIEIAQILDFIAEPLQLFIQVCVAQSRGTHVDTPSVSPEIHGHTNNRYFLHVLIVACG